MSQGTNVHTTTRRSVVFTNLGSNTWQQFSTPSRVDVLLVGGGGGGGGGRSANYLGGGGGAGGAVISARGYLVNGPMSINIGNGGGHSSGDGADGGAGSPTTVGPLNVTDLPGVGSGFLVALGGAGGSAAVTPGMGSNGGSSGGRGGLQVPAEYNGGDGLAFGAVYPVPNYSVVPPGGVLFPPIYGAPYGAGGGGGAGDRGGLGGGARYGAGAGASATAPATQALPNRGGGGGGGATGPGGYQTPSAGGSGIVIISWDE